MVGRDLPWRDGVVDRKSTMASLRGCLETPLVGGLNSERSEESKRSPFVEPLMWTRETRAEHDRDDLATPVI